MVVEGWEEARKRKEQEEEKEPLVLVQKVLCTQSAMLHARGRERHTRLAGGFIRSRHKVAAAVRAAWKGFV